MREILTTILNIIRWLAGIFIVLMGVIGVSEHGITNIIAGLAVAILGLLLLPPVAKRVRWGRVKHLKIWIATGIFIVFVVAAGKAPQTGNQANEQSHPNPSVAQVTGDKKQSVVSPSASPSPSVRHVASTAPSPSPSPSASPSISPMPSAATPRPTATSIKLTGYRWIDDGQGGVNYSSDGMPITREKFAAGAHQDISKIEQWVFVTYASHTDFRWADNGHGGVNYYAFDSPITREKFQTSVRAKGDSSTDVSKIEAWVAGIYDKKIHPVAASGTLKALGTRTKTSDCSANGALEDKACTPGAIFAVTAAQVCVSGYSSSVRSVSDATKNAVYAEYGISSHTSGQYEVDHLISLELGGSNDIANLWPEPADPTPGFHQKDTVENNLHAKVCSGSMSLATAQAEIADNWLAVYDGTYSKAPPAQPSTAAPAPSPPSATSGGIVKMSATHICHAPGTTYYDRTLNYTPYDTLQQCLNAGGRLPLK